MEIKIKKISLILGIGLIITVSSIVFGSIKAYALDENSCLSCHGNENLVKTTETGDTVSLYVNEKTLILQLTDT